MPIPTYDEQVVLGLEKSIDEERAAINAYTERKAEGASDVTTAKLYEHVLKDEHEHEKEFIHRLMEKAADMPPMSTEPGQDVSETQLRCAAAGLEIAREQESFKAEITTPVLFPRPSMYGRENLLVAETDFSVKAGSAGKQIVALVMVDKDMALIVHDDGKGGCGFIKGNQTDLLKPEFLEKFFEDNRLFKGG